MAPIYTEHIILDKNLALQSVDPNDPYFMGGTIIQGDTTAPVLTLDTGCEAGEIAGLTLRNGSVGIEGTATDATIRNCRIMDNIEHGVELSMESNPHLFHCLIADNGGTGVTMIDNTRGRTVTLCRPIIEACVIVHNGESSLVGGEPVLIESIID